MLQFFEDTCLMHIKPSAKTELESVVDEPIRIVGNDFVLQVSWDLMEKVIVLATFVSRKFSLFG